MIRLRHREGSDVACVTDFYSIFEELSGVQPPVRRSANAFIIP
jgi:hypothetical protein